MRGLYYDSDGNDIYDIMIMITVIVVTIVMVIFIIYSLIFPHNFFFSDEIRARRAAEERERR